VSGETDLAAMLAGLEAMRRPGTFTFVAATVPPASLVARAHAVVVEDEGTTLVLDVATARAEGLEVEFEAAWLTLTVHSALDAVGLTAAVSAALAADGIACNVLAGHHHDHLLVPADRADDALAALAALRASSPPSP
jgi:hypothetical protein